MQKAILLTAIVGSFAMLTVGPAAAKGKGAGVDKVIGACKRTAGCWYNSTGPGQGMGCSPKVCFVCLNGKCTQDAKGNPPRGGATLGGVRLPPDNVQASGGQIDGGPRRPIGQAGSGLKPVVDGTPPSGNGPRRPIETGSGLKPVVNSGIHQNEGPGGGMNHGGVNITTGTPKGSSLPPSTGHAGGGNDHSNPRDHRL